jgi:hypothetical protein
MVRWKLALGGGALALTLMLTGAVAGLPAGAQDSTPPAGASTGDTEDAAENAAELALYQDFVGKFATNLGQSDPAAVDAAIRATLTQMVDEQFAAGTISANEADALKQSIAASDSPIELLDDHGDKDGDHGRDGRESDDDNGGQGQGGQDEQGLVPTN